MCKCTSFSLAWTALFVGTIAKIYLTEKKIGIASWPIEGKKQYFTLLFFGSEENGE